MLTRLAKAMVNPFNNTLSIDRLRSLSVILY